MSAKKTTSKQTSAKKVSVVSPLLLELKLLTGLVCIVALLGLIWVNTGSRTQTSYTTCGGTPIPLNELRGSTPSGQIDPGGPCLGVPVTEATVGRYDDSAPLDWLFGTIAVLSLGAYMLLSQTKSK